MTEEGKTKEKEVIRQVKFNEEYFIPPSKKQMYLKQTNDSSF